MPRTIEKSAPRTLPPAAAAAEDTGQGAPSLDLAEVAEVVAAAAPGGPEMAPPAEVVEAAAAEEGIAAWHSAVKVTALWSNASVRNAWAAIEGVGWRRVNSANDSAFVTITALLSHARQMGASCNVRIESDNLIHEVYVW